MSELIRVAQIMGKMLGGGVESVVMNYYRHIDRTKVQFDFIVDADSSLIPYKEIESLGGRIFIVPPYQNVMAYQRALITLFREQEWQIIHSHENALSVFPLRAAKKAGVPVRIAHSHSTSGKGEPVRNTMKWVLKHFSLLYPTDLAACGVYAGKWLFGKNANFAVFPNAIELNNYSYNSEIRTEVRKQLGIQSEYFAIGHLGRFVSQKNHVFLIKAFARFHQMYSNSILILAGDGQLKQEMENLSRELQIENSVLFLGRRTDAYRLYQAFDLFALPSLYEGFCVVGVEAQAAGLPCLFSDAVTTEIGLSPNAEFLPLDLDVWANEFYKQVLDSPIVNRTMSPTVRAYNISNAAKKLQDYYIHLFSEVNNA